ncbi:hypothetical protein [sulfur-oxidizing endosymbiont of Gigantopelta aegis]|uniref:hypothetical protein n=1 Tax=sulfur-oxidizing endosymbiont of Gigantopelta aegis TaxID=2794934 RepID=UPI0018DE1A25|nr:hypothetical protein [sulfur-oxidizing endosymbiont of Gigantopelta aegis]
MGLFKSIFRGKDGDDESPRQIASPTDLTVGDMLKMEFSAQSLISGQTLKVTAQSFYDISSVENCKTVSTMEGADKPILLSKSSVNAERPLEVALLVLPDTVFDIFKQKKFAAIFDEPEDTDHRLSSKNSAQEIPGLEGFIAKSYFQERTNEAYRSDKDCRNQTLLDSQWTGFDYKLLVSDDRQHAVRIEVFDGGRTDVYLIAYLPLHQVAEYWPA